MALLETFLVSRFMVFVLVLAHRHARHDGPDFRHALHAKAGARDFGGRDFVADYAGISRRINTRVDSTAEFGRLLVNEVLVGLLLGLGINILFSGVQVAGQVVSQLSGMSLANVRARVLMKTSRSSRSFITSSPSPCSSA